LVGPALLKKRDSSLRCASFRMTTFQEGKSQSKNYKRFAGVRDSGIIIRI
jgi:hypothetical protein